VRRCGSDLREVERDGVFRSSPKRIFACQKFLVKQAITIVKEDT